MSFIVVELKAGVVVELEPSVSLYAHHLILYCYTDQKAEMAPYIQESLPHPPAIVPFQAIVRVCAQLDKNQLLNLPGCYANAYLRDCIAKPLVRHRIYTTP